MRTEVLGLPADILSKVETVDIISDWLKKKAKTRMVVTAYSEFYVVAQSDKRFAEILKKADLVTPDGVSVLAAVRYRSRMLVHRSRVRVRGSWLSDLRYTASAISEGLKVGAEILSGKVGEPVTGVWLFEELTRLSAARGWKIFLLGGWGDVGRRTTRRLQERFPNIKVKYDPGEVRVGTDRDTNARVIKKINAYKPDILFVAYNPVKQEKWIASHLSKLKVGVAVGVGGTFNEYLGEFKKAPEWMEKMGLKWLWRVIVEPRRLGRILRAIIVFPWLVFRKSL